jgi:hypothetical protein
MMAIGFSLNGWFGGREAQSMAFLRTPGTEKLYSGLTTRSASAAAMRSRKRSTEGGKPALRTSSL